MKDVTGFGALNIDLIYEGVDFETVERIVKKRLPSDSEDFYPPELFQPVMDCLNSHAKLTARSGGGSAANTVYALSGLGFSTGYIGKVGLDGDFLLDGLSNVDKNWIARGMGNSGCALCLQANGKRTIMIFPNENNTLTQDDINRDAYKTRFLHLSSFSGDNPFKAQVSMVQHLQPCVKVSFDPGAIYVGKGLQELLPMIGRTYVLFVNESELRMLTGKPPEEGCHFILNTDYKSFGEGPKIVACKRGEHGSMAMNRRGEYVEAKPVMVPRDKQKYPTGTGDAYNAGFLAGLLHGRDLGTCATYGNTLGAQKLRVPRENLHMGMKDLGRALS